MKIEQYMTRAVSTVTPTTKLFDAIDQMEALKLRRFPVVEDGRLVGLLTEATIAAALPSKATSLSVHETNFLLNKTTVADCMVDRPKVVTIQREEWLEAGVAKMLAAKVPVLPVVNESDEVEGIITNNDIFQAFLSLTGYNQKGVRVLLTIPHDQKGVLAALTAFIATEGWDIVQLVVDRSLGYPVINLQLTGADLETVEARLAESEYQLAAVRETGKESRN